VPKLIEMLTEPGGEMRDDALTIMVLIVRHPDGNAAIGSMNVVSTLVELIKNGSSVNKENATYLIVYLCRRDPVVHLPILSWNWPKMVQNVASRKLHNFISC
jgi:hypothetical protein